MSLTENWKSGKLRKSKRYWVKSPLFLDAKPAFLYNDNSFDIDGTIYSDTYDLSVLDSCDYEELQNLKNLLRECIPFLGYASSISISTENVDAIELMVDKIIKTLQGNLGEKAGD